MTQNKHFQQIKERRICNNTTDNHFCFSVVIVCKSNLNAEVSIIANPLTDPNLSNVTELLMSSDVLLTPTPIGIRIRVRIAHKHTHKTIGLNKIIKKVNRCTHNITDSLINGCKKVNIW